MATRRFKIVLEWDPEEAVWVTYVPSLDHLSTFGETREEAIEQTREAIVGYLEVAAAEHIPLPEGEPELELAEVEVAVA